jgi:hypothetical protein
MIASSFTRTLCVVAVAFLALAHDVRAQNAQPTAAAVALAKQIVDLKGATTMFDSVVLGVIEYHKKVLLQANPTSAKDLEAVSNQLAAEFGPRKAEVQMEIARAYAGRFTEQELKEILAFYKTPLGKKLVNEEPKGVDDATSRVDAWASKYAEEVLTKMRAEMKKRGHNLL